MFMVLVFVVLAVWITLQLIATDDVLMTLRWGLGLVVVTQIVLFLRGVLFQQILRETPPPARRLNPAISRDLATVLEAAMAKEPNRRYASAEALACDLARVRRGEPKGGLPVPGRDSSMPKRRISERQTDASHRRWWRRSRGMARPRSR